MPALDLLGPVVLGSAAGAVALSVKKAQALLVLLALGGTMPRARVVALLWPQLDESTGRRNLRRELARLREVGAAQAVRAEGDRLALSEEVSCDARNFETALRQGQPDRALALWRGPPADGLELDDAQGFGDWLATERERLLGVRRRALEASAAGHEARGDHEAALRRIESLLAEDALQEQHHRDAMRLHAACGRREAALAQYQRCCRLLKDELDLQPMAETEALAASLRGAPAARPHPPPAAPAPAVPVPAALLPGQMPFVGRSAEVAALEAAWRAGQAVLIEGEAGVGKTRLACDFAAAHGPYALVRCRPGDAAVPYAAFTRALRVLAGPAPELGGLPPWVQSELARLLPEFGAAPPPLRSPAESSRFFEACTQAWLALAGYSFDAVILDDWHHADAASQALLGFIAQRRREAGQGGAREVLVLRAELDLQALESLRRLGQAAAALHLRLQPLPPQAVLELVQRLSGARSPQRFAARLGQATAGNPFFIAETLRHLAEQKLLLTTPEGTWSTPFDDATLDYRELPVPASVHEAVLARVRRMPAAARRVLEAAALAAEPFMPALLAPACALSELDAVLAIEQAVEACLLREHEAGGFAFAHDLVQQALDASLSAERRRLVHRRLALGAEAAAAPAAVVAMHHEASGDARRAVAHRLAAGDEAERLHALAEAIAHWMQGLADQPGPAQAMALHRRLMRCTNLSGRAQACVEHTTRLQALADGASLAPGERVDALIDVARYLSYNERQPEGLALLDSLPAPGSELQRAQWLAARADVLRELGRVDEAAQAARAALALPALQGRERAGLLSTLALIEHRAGRLRAAAALTGESVALARQLGDDVGVARAKNQRGTFLSMLGELPEAEAELLSAAEYCERLGLVGMQRSALYSLCVVYATQTRPAQVLATATRGWELQPELAAGGLRLVYRMAFVDSNLSLGRLGAAWSHAEPALAEAAAINELYAVVAVLVTSLELLALVGEQARAGALIAMLGDEQLRQMPQHANDLWLVRAKVALMDDQVAAAAQALAQVTPRDEIVIERVQLFSGLVAAELALAQGDAQGALAALPAPEAPGMSDEMRLRGLALRVAAQALGGALPAATVAAAQAALQTEVVHAAAALYLHRALAAAQRDGVAGAPATAPRDCAAHVARLADSLAKQPAQRASFLRAWSA